MSGQFSSLSPIDGGVVWNGQASGRGEVAAAIEHSVAAGRHWRSVPVDDRIAIVRRYAQALEQHRDEITALLSREVGKLPWDAASEVAAAIAKVELSITALQQRRSEQVLQDGETQRRIRFHALGVTLVLGPFNFPLHLPGGQIIPALLAGNTVVFKPSDQAPAIGQWMAQLWDQAGLPDGVLQVIHGGVETATAAIDSADIDAVFLTGSRAAGRAIHRQLAGRPGVLLALELGGNNPVVVTHSVPPSTAAAIVSFSAFVSAGQRCTCARRAIFLQGQVGAAQIDELIKITGRLRVGMPDDVPAPQLGPLISPAAAINLQRTHDDLCRLGCHSLVPLQIDGSRPSLVRPGIVDASGINDAATLRRIGELEWFGPLLVIQRVENFDTAMEHAAQTPYGLAAALLGGTRPMFDRFVDEVGAGVVNWNSPTTGAAGALPFGGLGDSGNHRPAGFYAIDFCNDPVASLERAEPADTDPWGIAS